MSKLLAVAAREVRERSLLFPAGLVISFLPFVLRAFGVQREHAPVVGLVGAVLFRSAAAVVIGSSMLARDAATGRLGFLFSRPVSWPIIWGGKWLAALVLVVASGVLAAIPSMTAYRPERGGSWLDSLGAQGSAFLLLLILIGIGAANFNATVFRSRSAWAALDLGLFLLALWAVRRFVAPLFMFGLMGLRGAWGELLRACARSTSPWTEPRGSPPPRPPRPRRRTSAGHPSQGTEGGRAASSPSPRAGVSSPSTAESACGTGRQARFSRRSSRAPDRAS